MLSVGTTCPIDTRGSIGELIEAGEIVEATLAKCIQTVYIRIVPKAEG